MDETDAASFARSLRLTDLFPDTLELSNGSSAQEGKTTTSVYPSGWTTGEPYAIEWVDLVRLHALLRLRRVLRVLEFGCGYSTTLMAYSLSENERDFGSFVRAELRGQDPFKVHSVDDVRGYIDIARNRIPLELRSRAEFLYAKVRMTTFNDRICTEYEQLPNICPDFIYLDGPDQHDVEGDVCGISTRHFDRWPMACDILKMEHFLLPGTMILVDGRTANARFLKTNLQREWRYEHDVDGDVHYFEMIEEPLGKWNRRQIEFCLGPDWRAKPLKPDYSKLVS
ncbi:MAG: hypothetical protein ACKOI3_01475 [Actinomycetota bacterium]